MGFDVNKIIMESLADVNEVETEVISEAKTEVSYGDTIDTIRKNLKEAKDTAITHGVKHGKLDLDSDTRDALTRHAVKRIKETPEDIQNLPKKVIATLADHPVAGMSAAAIAAGLGALALRKKLKKTSK